MKRAATETGYEVLAGSGGQSPERRMECSRVQKTQETRKYPSGTVFQAGRPLQRASTTRVCLLTLTEITGGAPLLPHPRSAKLPAEKLGCRRAAHKGASDFEELTASLNSLRKKYLFSPQCHLGG